KAAGTPTFARPGGENRPRASQRRGSSVEGVDRPRTARGALAATGRDPEGEMFAIAQRTAAVLGMAALGLLLQAGPAQAKPTGAAARRTGWLYNKGSFKKASNGQWLEQAPKAKFSFREVARNDHYVGLYDASRQMHVRLYDRSAYWWTPKTKKWQF